MAFRVVLAAMLIVVFGCFEGNAQVFDRLNSLVGRNSNECADQGAASLQRDWHWHFPRETPHLRNGNRRLRCENGDRGFLYTRDDIPGQYFVTDRRYRRQSPITSNMCAAIASYCLRDLAALDVTFFHTVIPPLAINETVAETVGILNASVPDAARPSPRLGVFYVTSVSDDHRFSIQVNTSDHSTPQSLPFELRTVGNTATLLFDLSGQSNAEIVLRVRDRRAENELEVARFNLSSLER
ncbi:hypothetical protein [Hyphobacterium sp.]|jgi:hypothetical protein|uniref:hypothetical protein n=1 Tax=Hyphobacterium sp. TaxID=2004662 RepID=UPI003BA8572F